MLQANKAKFHIENAHSICPICRIEEENLIHFITRCPVLGGIRRKHYGTIKQEIVNKIRSIQWNSKFRDRYIICQLKTDCRKLTGEYLPYHTELMNGNIESTSRRMCYDMHVKRLNAMYID